MAKKKKEKENILKIDLIGNVFTNHLPLNAYANTFYDEIVG